MAITFPVQVDILCGPDAQANESPGIDWLSPYRWVDESPTNPAAHDHAVCAALAWLRQSPFAWFEPIAAAFGIWVFTDGREVAVVISGSGHPARITRITLGFISGAPTGDRPPEGGTLQ